MRLGDLAATLFMGVNIGRSANASTNAAEVPVIHVRDVADGSITELEKLDRVPLSTSPQNSKQYLRSTDVLVSARGSLMKCSTIPTTHLGTVASANFIVVRLRENSKLMPELLCGFLRHPRTQSYVFSRVSSTAQLSLNIKEVADLEIPIPPLENQQSLTRLLRVSDEQFRISTELASLRREHAINIVTKFMEDNNE